MLALLAGAILGPDWSAPITTPPPGSTTLHLLPNHQCTGAGEYSDADGKHPYCTKDEARAACVAAGCDGLAERKLLINATYAKRPPKDGYYLGYCVRGWVSNFGDLWYWLPEDRPEKDSCGPGFTKTSMPSCGGAYCVGCPADLTVCPPPSPPYPCADDTCKCDAVVVEACSNECRFQKSDGRFGVRVEARANGICQDGGLQAYHGGVDATAKACDEQGSTAIQVAEGNCDYLRATTGGLLRKACELGTDCDDCGPRRGYPTLCSNACLPRPGSNREARGDFYPYVNDKDEEVTNPNPNGICQDGGPGSERDDGEGGVTFRKNCAFGTDCDDCGPRCLQFAPPPAPASPPAPPSPPPQFPPFAPASLPAGCSLVVSGSGYCRSHKVVKPPRASSMWLPASYREQCNALVRADPECASNTFSWGRVATEKGGACLCDRAADCEICGRDDAEAQVDSGNPCSLYERVAMTCEEAEPSCGGVCLESIETSLAGRHTCLYLCLLRRPPGAPPVLYNAVNLVLEEDPPCGAAVDVDDGSGGENCRLLVEEGQCACQRIDGSPYSQLAWMVTCAASCNCTLPPCAPPPTAPPAAPPAALTGYTVVTEGLSADVYNPSMDERACRAYAASVGESFYGMNTRETPWGVPGGCYLTTISDTQGGASGTPEDGYYRVAYNPINESNGCYSYAAPAILAAILARALRSSARRPLSRYPRGCPPATHPLAALAARVSTSYPHPLSGTLR